MVGKKNKSNIVGRALIKDRFGKLNRQRMNNDSMLHTTEIEDGYDWGRLNLQSVTEESSFNEFLRTAEIAGTEFKAEKLNISFVSQKKIAGLMSDYERSDMQRKHIENKDLLKIPRRPKWSAETTGEELKTAENESFLEWRKGLAMLQENDGFLLTPYEKNLEFWRQLWRVIERSDVVIQIVDSRNPLLFRNEDLDKYVKEIDNNKMNVILCNKADFLTVEQRLSWAEYFDSLGQKVVFFSATMAAEELKTLASIDEENELNKTSERPMTSESVQEATQTLVKALDKIEDQLSLIESKLNRTSFDERNNPKILNRHELIHFFKTIYKGPKKTSNVTTIGLVGYPNVGKSSTINSLMAEKKVSVSATPGKTKHFQTLYLDNDIILCDCPGLVMPSFVCTKADMILNGILPIDQMRDHVPPVNLLCTQIPRHILEEKYGIVMAKPLENEDPNRNPYSEDLLLAYGYNRGYMTANGQPDQSRSARYVLKDYVNGRLLYCHAPPSVPQSDFHKFEERKKKEVEEESLPDQQRRAMRIDKNNVLEVMDEKFFQSNNSGYIKGRSNFPHIRVPATGTSVSSGSMQSLNGIQFMEKPWRNVKKEKREKLRNKFAHLDQH